MSAAEFEKDIIARRWVRNRNQATTVLDTIKAGSCMPIQVLEQQVIATGYVRSRNRASKTIKLARSMGALK